LGTPGLMVNDNNDFLIHTEFPLFFSKDPGRLSSFITVSDFFSTFETLLVVFILFFFFFATVFKAEGLLSIITYDGVIFN
jgi:hypothetical protein